MMYQDEDEDDDKEDILKMLRGEVSDFAGSQLEDPDKPKGVTITIAMEGKKPDMPMPMKKEDDKEDMDDSSEDHIAHILGMCGGGCAMCKGGMA